jgi:glutathione S-transferase
MAVTLYYLSGSPYAWRVWLALEHKGIPCTLQPMSYDAGDFSKPDFVALNPRRRVPVIVDDGYVLYESAAIVEYLADKWPGAPHLLSPDPRRRGVQRRMIREADQYVAEIVERLVHNILFTPREKWAEDRIASAHDDLKAELAIWETMIAGDYLDGELTAVDFALFPLLALVHRMDTRKVGLVTPDLIGPKMAAWSKRMTDLPIIQETWPPHWK